MNNNEIWKTVPGYPSYEVSDHGRLRRTADGVFLNPSFTDSGRPFVNLTRNKVKESHQVRRIVAAAFLPPSHVLGARVTHVDGDVANCRADNLTWSEKISSKRLKSKVYLTPDQIKEIVQRSVAGESQQQLSDAFGISRPYVSLRVNGKCRSADSDHLSAPQPVTVEIKDLPEEWRTVAEHPHMEISNKGRLRRCGSAVCLSPVKVCSGHMKFCIRNNGVTAQVYASKMVARAFLPKPDDNHDTVAHLNGDPTCNDAQNLAWMTRSAAVRLSRQK